MSRFVVAAICGMLLWSTAPGWGDKPDCHPQDQQAWRQRFRQLQQQRIFYKLEIPRGGAGQVYVSTGFYRLPIDQKEGLLRWVLQFAVCDGARIKEVLQVFDDKTGRQIATWGLASGLRWR